MAAVMAARMAARLAGPLPVRAGLGAAVPGLAGDAAGRDLPVLLQIPSSVLGLPKPGKTWGTLGLFVR
jgi:hypothetical protein